LKIAIGFKTKIMKKIIWFLSILLISVTTKAQNFANDCTNAIVICGNENIVSNATGIGNTQEIINGCGSSEHNTIWIKINIVQAGTLGFNLTPSDPDLNVDYDFWVFGPNRNCGTTLGNPIRCNTVSPLPPPFGANLSSNVTGMNGSTLATQSGPGPGSTGSTGYVRWLDVLPGQFYYIAIDRPGGEGGFELEWIGSAMNGTGAFPTPPTANTIPDYEVCSSSPNLGIFDLDSVRASINPDLISNEITFHETYDLAFDGIDPLPNIINNTTNPQLIFAKVKNITTGCFSITSFNLVVNPIPQVTMSVSNSTICAGEEVTVTFTGTPGGIVQYNNGSSPLINATLATDGTFSFTQTITSTTTFSLNNIKTYDNLGQVICTQQYTNSITVAVNPKPLIASVTPTPICSGTAFSVTPIDGSGNIVPSGTTYTWTISSNTNITGAIGSSATGISTISQTLINTSNTVQTIIYTVTPTSGVTGNCVGTNFTITLDVNPIPVITNVPNPSICSGAAFSVTPTNGSGNIAPSGTTYTWTISSNTNITGASGSSATGISTISQTLINTSNTVQTIIYTVTPTSGTCVGSDFTITVDVNPKPLIASVTPTPICSGTAFSVTPTDGIGNIVPSGTTYTWTISSNTNITGAIGSSATGISTISQTLINTSNTVQTIIYTVTPTSGTCVGSDFTITVDVNPKPLIASVTPTPICSGTAFSVTPTDGIGNIVPSGTTYTWTISSNTNITGVTASTATGISTISQVLTNTSNTIQTITYTVTPTSGASGNCVGSDFTITVAVNPKPFIANVIPTPICSGIAFSVTPTDGSGNIVPSGTTYTWTTPISNPVGAITGGTDQATGIATISQTLTNTTSSPATLEYIITPTSGTCVGADFTVTVDVNPKPLIASVTPTPICSGTAFSVTPIDGSGNIVPSGTTYTWTISSNTNITGAIGSSATGISTISQTLINTSNTVQTIIYTVTPTSGVTGNCVGTNFTITLDVNPIPVITNVPNPSICSGAAFSVTPTNGSGNIAPSGTTYTWATPISNPVGAITGGTAQATGIATISQTLINTTSSPATLLYTVTPTSGTCVGADFTVTVDVNPKPLIASVTPTPICSGTAFSVTPTDGIGNIVPSGTTYTWTISANTNITGATASTATGISTISQVLTNTSNTVQTITYTVTPTSGATGNCVGADFTVTVDVSPTPTLILSSAVTTTNQTICVNSPIVPIQYTFDAGATGVTVTGLPAGISPTINGNVVTISGTPTTTAAIFNYTVTATGSLCGTPSLSGVIEVTNGILPRFTQVTPVCQGATINIPTSSNNTPPIVGVWNLISSTANDVTYEFTPNAGQCGLNTTMTIVVHPLPTVIPSVTTQSFCSGGTTNINLVPDVAGSVFYWTATGTTVTGQSGSVIGSGATSINQTLTLNANQVAAGQVTYSIVAEANGCLGAPVTVVVTVNPIPNVIVSPVSLTETICSGGTTNISFSGAINNTVYSWSVVSSVGVSGALNGSGAAINQTLTTTGLSQGTVVYEVTPSLNGCTGTPQRITVTVNPVPEIFGSASHPDLCSGESTFISVSTFNATTVFNWTVDPVGVSGASAGTATGSSINIAQALTTTGNTRGYVDYIITPVLTGCPGIPITVRVYVNPLPVVSLTDGTICVDAAGVPFQTYVLDSGLNDVDYDFVWTFQGNTIPGATSATYTATQVGTYTVVATNSTTNCVSNIASAVVTATNPATNLTVTQSEYFSDNATLVVTVTGGNGTLLYQLDQGALQESNVFTGVTGGTHIITVVDTQGCTYLTQEVLVIDYPKYFTPNGDGHNDTWNITGMDQSDAKLYIFDRYGKLVKQIVPSILSDGWDGTFNNIPLPSTDYWFTLDYTENGAQKQFKAHFSLKR
jgi:gliding motility-associated-like protein